MKFTSAHLARIYKAKYSLTFAEGYCIASKFFEIASSRTRNKVVRNASHIEGILMVLYAQERIDQEVVTEVLDDLKSLVMKLPSADASVELQIYIAELFATITVDAINSALSESEQLE